MIDFTESQIILAVIGIVGLFTTLAVYSRASRANQRLELKLKRAIEMGNALTTTTPTEEIEVPN